MCFLITMSLELIRQSLIAILEILALLGFVVISVVWSVALQLVVFWKEKLFLSNSLW